MPIVNVTHRTTYRYSTPVALGDHTIIRRPKLGSDTRLIGQNLEISPPATITSTRDAFGNIVETASFKDKADELSFVSTFSVQHTPRTPGEIESQVRSHGNRGINSSEAPELMRAAKRHRADPEGLVAAWANDVKDSLCGGNSFDLMVAMTGRINDDFRYASRESEGTNDPLVTLKYGSGSCRDFALFMMEAARSLGYPARFVSGYLYNDEEMESGAEQVGGGSTHAWAEINIPGAGWVEFDPTNNYVGGRNLVAVAVVLEPSQAIPIYGSYTGFASDYIGMTVDVGTSAVPDGPSYSDGAFGYGTPREPAYQSARA